MCQQWWSVIGLLAELIGFLLVAREWYHVFKLDELGRRNRIEEDYERVRAEAQGKEWVSPSSKDYTHAKDFDRMLTRDIKYRSRLFFGGAVLIVLGMILQMVGSWPGSASC